MAPIAVLQTARRLRAVFICGWLMLTIAPSWAETPDSPSSPTTAAVPSNTATSVVIKPQQRAQAITKPQQSPQSAAKPLWTELTSAQQQALVPLASEWDKLDSLRKNKWLAIGNKYATMSPAEQQRVQERMRDWVKLTPEQRRIARESYARAKKLNPDQKSAQWRQYQQLPEDQKKKLAADAASKKHVATLPSASAQGKNSKTIPPIKSALKPVIERPATPQAAAQSAPQPSPPSTTK